jgi:hypothetical protein
VCGRRTPVWPATVAPTPQTWLYRAPPEPFTNPRVGLRVGDIAANAVVAKQTSPAGLFIELCDDVNAHASAASSCLSAASSVAFLFFVADRHRRPLCSGSMPKLTCSSGVSGGGTTPWPNCSTCRASRCSPISCARANWSATAAGAIASVKILVTIRVVVVRDESSRCDRSVSTNCPTFRSVRYEVTWRCGCALTPASCQSR